MAKVVLDDWIENGLQRDVLIDGVRVCAGQPTSFADVATKTLASASLANPTIGAGSPDGRQANYVAASAILISTSGTADHIAYVDTVNSRYVVTTCGSTALVANGSNTVSVGAVARRIGAVS